MPGDQLFSIIIPFGQQVVVSAQYNHLAVQVMVSSEKFQGSPLHQLVHTTVNNSQKTQGLINRH